MRDPKKYDYMHSDALGVEIASAKDGSHVWTADGVRYADEEIKALGGTGITPKIHRVKKIFTRPYDGGIVR
jgi:hypothetical protein